MSFRADLALYDREGRLRAVAEVKNRLGTSPRWAAQTRRNILAHGALGQSDFFLLITPDRIYVWKDVGVEPVEVPPSYEGESQPLFARYFAGAGIAPGKATGQAFEMLVAAWLGDLTRRPSYAKAVLDELSRRGGHAVRPGEIMALINGNFVHVGQALAVVAGLERASVLAVEVAALFHSITRANPSNLYFVSTAERAWAVHAVRHIAERDGRPPAAADVQDPVSMRAIPQVLETWGVAVDDFLEETNYLLFKPSCNPFIDERHAFPISQASFLAPTLSVKTGALIDAAMFLMWAVLGWAKHLLRGRVDGVPRDGSTSASPLGLIQHPKLMQAMCEQARIDLGRRTFAAGSDTSYGIVDLWTNGVFALAQLEQVLDELQGLFCRGLWIVKRLVEDFDLDGRARSDLLDACAECATVGEVERRVSAQLAVGRPRSAHELFWRGR